jgi:methionyl-tRNA synthetase
MSDVKSAIIDQAQQQRMVRDTLILQKVNRVHREAFKVKFPTQCEHVMRLTAERLQAVLTNKPQDLADPETWTATANEIRDLAEALYYLALISKDNPVEE